MAIQWNLWHPTKIYSPKVFLLTKLKPEYSDVLYHSTHFPGPLVCRMKQILLYLQIFVLLQKLSKKSFSKLCTIIEIKLSLNRLKYFQFSLNFGISQFVKKIPIKISCLFVFFMTMTMSMLSFGLAFSWLWFTFHYVIN